MKKAVETQAAPKAIGPYSQAIAHGDWIFCSGQIGIDPALGTMVEGGIEAETRRVLDNLRAVLAAAGLKLTEVIKTTVFLINLADFETVNRIYGEYFNAPFPARSTVQVSALPRHARIEIEAIACR
ncbi:MAG TPA: RidA family protein [Candidatus Binataceae bacterium]|jgi:2-iminobutanoate/2-iminopropanoate deaminase|nr:RidA family protein [Candidatus Binataceae bacterium]